MSRLNDAIPLSEMECPHCDAELATEDIVMELCSEPFNGIVIECPECGKELDIEMYVRVSKND